MKVDRRVFIVGVPRSGTTLLQSLMAAHSEVASFTESHFFSVAFYGPPRAPFAIVRRDPRARILEFLAENRIDVGALVDRLGPSVSLLSLDPARARPWSSVTMRLRPGTMARQWLTLLDGIALLEAKTTWVEKTPHNVRFIPFIERISVPVAPTHFVHVIRDGLEVVTSLCRASRSWPKPYTVKTAVARWNDEISLSLRRAESPRDSFVFYDDLVDEPGPVVRRVLETLGLEWEPRILAKYGAVAERLTVPRETWKRETGRTIGPSDSSASTLTLDERRWAQGALRNDLYARLRRSALR